MTASPVIALSDGKPGHAAATAGILEALGQLIDVETVRIELRLRAKLLRPLLGRALEAVRAAEPARQGALAARVLSFGYRLDRALPARASAIVSTGGDTLYANALAGRITGAPTIFCGSLRGVDPVHFTRIVTNRSASPDDTANAVVLDLAPMPRPAPLVETGGQPSDSRPTVAILIGGDGSGYHFGAADWLATAALLGRLDRAAVGSLVTTSRRTPVEAEAAIEAAARDCMHLARLVLWGRAPERVMADFLARADAFVVTPESATMVTEAVLAGKPVYLAGPEPVRPEPRHERLIAQIVAEGQARRLAPGETPIAPFGEGWFRPLARHPVDQLAEALAPVMADQR